MTTPVSLHYAEAGRGLPVVLLHGFPLTSAIWRPQQRDLSDRYRIIAPDLRGHGQSPVPPGAYAMDLLAGDVLALLDVLAIEKAVIMGHSMGGYVALAMAKAAPQRLLALGLIASQTGADSEEARQGRFKMAAKVAAEGSKAIAKAMLPRLFAPDLPQDAPALAEASQLMLATQPAGIIGALQGMAGRPDSRMVLSSLTVPVLLVAGRKDQIITPERVEAMAASASKATVTFIENAGHMPMMEQPQATTSALRNFLGQVAPS